MPTSAAILLAAGSGSRMRGAVPDKILARLAGRTVFAYSLTAFVDAGIVSRFVIVYRDEAQRAKLVSIFARSAARDFPVSWVAGGAERQDSVSAALDALAAKKNAGRGRARVDRVFIHDCARPLVRPEVLRALDGTLRRDGAACLAHRVVDTIKQLPKSAASPARQHLLTLDRSRLWAMETPQAFRLELITTAYRRVRKRRLRITDDAAALEATSDHRVTLVENSHPNPKITRPADLAWATFLFSHPD